MFGPCAVTPRQSTCFTPVRRASGASVRRRVTQDLSCPQHSRLDDPTLFLCCQQLPSNSLVLTDHFSAHSLLHSESEFPYCALSTSSHWSCPGMERDRTARQLAAAAFALRVRDGIATTTCYDNAWPLPCWAPKPGARNQSLGLCRPGHWADATLGGYCERISDTVSVMTRSPSSSPPGLDPAPQLPPPRTQLPQTERGWEHGI